MFWLYFTQLKLEDAKERFLAQLMLNQLIRDLYLT